MSRPRICCVMSANPAGITKSQLSDEQFKEHKRRAKFERNYERNKAIFAGVTIRTSELLRFSNGVANAIAEFKKSKQQ